MLLKYVLWLTLTFFVICYFRFRTVMIMKTCPAMIPEHAWLQSRCRQWCGKVQLYWMESLPEAMNVSGLRTRLCCNLEYPAALKRSFDFIQTVILSLGQKSLKPKIQSPRSRRMQEQVISTTGFSWLTIIELSLSE